MATYTETEIGELVDRVRCWSPATDSDNAEFTYIDLSSVDKDSKSIASPVRTPCAEAPSRARQLVAYRDVLVSTVRPNLNGVAAVPHELDGATASTGFCVLRPRPERVCWRYLYHWVRSPTFIRDMTRKATGASYPAVSERIIQDSKIPLPTLEEQKRIAAILDKADAIRRKRQEAIVDASKITSSLFYETFGDPLHNPKEWDVTTLAEISTKITDGVHAKPNYTDSGVPFVSVKDITTGRLILDDPKYISKEDHASFYKRCNPERGDILYTKVGATYGRPAIVDIDDEFSLYVSVALIKPDRSKVNPVFLNEVLASDAVKRQSDRSIKGAGVPDLHLVEIRKFRIPLPPLDVQDEFVRKCNAIHKYESHLLQYSDIANDLFNSLVQRAFKGEL